MEKKFASQADLAEKNISFVQLGAGAYAYTAEGDPNTGIVVGDDGVMVVDTQATPVMAQDVIRRTSRSSTSSSPTTTAITPAAPRGSSRTAPRSSSRATIGQTLPEPTRPGS